VSPDDYVKDAGITADSGDPSQSERPRSLPLLEGWTALTALARDTTRLRLGTSVLCNSYRHPSVLAKTAATLDVISEGRLDLGLGAGWFAREFEAYGIPFPSVRDRVSALDESLQVIRAVWTEPNPTYAGQFYTLNGAVCDPPPVQRPHPPLWIGGEGDRVHRIAAKSAQGLNVRWWSPQQVTQRRSFLTQACEANGRDPDTLRLSVTAGTHPLWRAGSTNPCRIRLHPRVGADHRITRQMRGAHPRVSSLRRRSFPLHDSARGPIRISRCHWS
jgi:probable F420-dependent oxidoreductase